MATDEQKLNVKKMLVSQLRLRMEPNEVDDSSPLFGEGLGLDSVDAIELVAGIEKVYGVTIASEEEARSVLGNVESLADYLVARGALA